MNTSGNFFENRNVFGKQTERSLFSYVTDTSRFVHHGTCADYTPATVSYIPTGTPSNFVDIENELKGLTRLNSKCTEEKYKGNKDCKLQTKKECEIKSKILPKGFLPGISYK